MRQRSLVRSTRLPKVIFCGSVENQYFVGSASPFGHSINSHIPQINRVQSSRRLERECQRNIELVWLTGRLMPDFKTIADFRKDNGAAIREVCREFVVL